MKKKKDPRSPGSEQGSGHTSRDSEDPPNSPTPNPERRTAPKVARSVTPLYLQIMAALEQRRLALGISMDKLSEFAGVADRFYSKALYPNAGGGRQATWGSLQCFCDVLMPDGIDVRIVPRPGPLLDDIRYRFGLRYDKALAPDARTRRELLREWGARGGARQRELTQEERSKIGRKFARARNRKLPKNKRSELASRASRARWGNRDRSKDN